MPPLTREEEMDAMNSGNESDHDLISTEMVEDIRDGSQTHPNVNKRESLYKCVIIYVITLFRSGGNASSSDVYPVCDVFERTN